MNEAVEKALMGSTYHNIDAEMEDENNQKDAEIMSARNHDNDKDDFI